MIITFVHHKGGTGKTTSCISITGLLAKQGNKVLAVDLDPQGNLTSGLGIDKASVKKSVFDVLNKKTLMKNIVLDTGIENIHVAPSTGKLLKTYNLGNDMLVLDKALKGIKGNYDFVLIDTPPSHGNLILNAALASDKVVLVLDPGVFALEGVQNLQEAFDECKTFKKVNIDAVILTKYKPFLPFLQVFKEKPVREVEAELRKSYKAFLIPYSNDVYDSHKKGLPISHYKPGSKVAKAYEKVVKEVLGK